MSGEILHSRKSSLSPVQAAADVLIRESFIMRHRDGPVMIQMRQSV